MSNKWEHGKDKYAARIRRFNAKQKLEGLRQIRDHTTHRYHRARAREITQIRNFTNRVRAR